MSVLTRTLWCVVCGVLAACSAPALRSDPQVGQPLSLAAEDLRTGRPIDLQPWLGHVVLVDLWASWCVSCKDAMPHHAETWNRLHGKGLEILAVSVDEDRDAALAFVHDTPLPFTVAWDAGQRAANVLQPREMPMAYVVDRQGRVALVAAGATVETLMAIDQAIAQALARPGL